MLIAGVSLGFAAASRGAEPAATPAGQSLAATSGAACARTIEADIVALDQPIFLNRLGASLPGGMIYALRRDVVPNSGSGELVAGQVQLDPHHRPRPLVLRARVGDCLHIKFENLLSPEPIGPGGAQACGNEYPEQTCTRSAGVHIYGMDEQAVNGTLLDGSFVGANPPSIVAPSGVNSPVLPSGKIDYTVRAGAEGLYLMYSTGTDVSTANSGGGLGGQLSAGLFGSVVVEPRGAEWYRSQVSKLDLDAATFNADALPPGYTLNCLGESCQLVPPQGSGNPMPAKRGADGRLTTPDGHPLLNYAATRALADGSCEPVLRMVDVGYQSNNGQCAPLLDSTLRTYHGDLTAAITGPNAGAFPAGDVAPPFNPNAVEPNRHEPYREFVEHYHDAITMISSEQAFPGLYGSNPVLGNGGEAFAINYGADGIGSEILANRVGTGPEGGCVDCRFEEFFLSAWAIGDPAELVGKPDGLAPNPATRPVPYTPKTVLREDDNVKYPDDPSNVYHSYIGDRVVFRIVHAGQLVTHLHHLHAHQWLHSRNNDESTYLDSQLISPGSTYTQEIDYDGSGNRNRTVGDAIFHCHFYPHFAAGMWGMWRSHDVFEAGTDLTKDPAKEFTRALPDGELSRGTPIPALVPLPTIAMAPLPARVKICPVDRSWNGSQVLGSGDECPKPTTDLSGEAAFIAAADFSAGINPGYPFFMPGIAGQRAPHPPMSYPPDQGKLEPGQTATLDGGLARHVVLAGEVSNDHSNAWDFSKDLDKLTALQLPEAGTPLEQVAMKTHNVCEHPSTLPDGSPAKFLLNGGPSVPGAPYANPSWGSNATAPCTDLASPPPPAGNPGKPSRIYKAADVQTDVVFNKLGWHYPQERFETLWQDVAPTVEHKRAPEPLFFRANSGETIEFWQTNLVPAYYELDDYQVRTPTDVIGQHIHLVKFDVTASDGAANGFNYEAGSLSSDAVREEIAAIRATNKCAPGAPISFQCPKAKAPPAELGKAPAGQDWLGAQTTVERWWADPVMDNAGIDRTLRTVFTHDHFSPSTHQQIGLYAGLLVEPAGSKWTIPAAPDPGTGKVATNVPMGTRPDGGPTSWAADIELTQKDDSYREFALEFQSIALEYLAGSPAKPGPYPCEPLHPSQSSYNCTDGSAQPTSSTPYWGWADQAAAVNPPSSQGQTVEGLAPSLITVGNGGGSVNYRNEPLPARTQSAGGGHDPNAANQDLALAWASIKRNDPNLNVQPVGPRKLQAPEPQVSVDFPGKFVGAIDEDPYTPMLRAYPGDKVQIRVLVGAHEDPHTFSLHGLKWLMEPSAKDSGHVSAQPMGISEHFELLFTMPPATGGAQADYLYEPDANTSGQQDGMWGILRAYNSPQPDLPALPGKTIKAAAAAAAAGSACPADAHHVAYAISAVTAAQAVKGGKLVYNSRTRGLLGPIAQPDGILYVLSADLDTTGALKDGVPIEPLVLRAAAGDCIDVTLKNRLDPAQQDVTGDWVFNSLTPDSSPVAATLSYSLYPSARVGLHAQLVDEDVTRSDGTRVGLNPDQTAAPGAEVSYSWYAGARSVAPDGAVKFTPVELGAINLLPADPIEQPAYGAVGALVVEPAGAEWRPDFGTRASATIFAPGTEPFREFVAVWQSLINKTSYTESYAQGGGPAPVGVSTAINYRSEPAAYRLPTESDLSTFESNIALAPPGTSPGALKVPGWDPQTPIFSAAGGMKTRFRFLNPGGQQTLAEIHGHHWQEEPWSKDSTRIADNPDSEIMGAYFLGPVHALNLVVDSAGGADATPGDYLYHDFIATPGDYSMWGLFRVEPRAKDVVVVKTYDRDQGDGGAVLTGYVTAISAAGGYAATVTGGGASAAVDPADGHFKLALAAASPSVTVSSANGGQAVAMLPGGQPLLTAAAIGVAPQVSPAPLVEHPALTALKQKAAKFVNRAVRQKLQQQP